MSRVVFLLIVHVAIRGEISGLRRPQIGTSARTASRGMRSLEWPPHRFESLRGARARIRDSNSKELREVNVAEIRGLPALTFENLDERLARQRTSGDPIWDMATRREEVIRQAILGPGLAKPRIRCAADSLKVSTRT